ncbi:TonB-dependent receptor [Polaribacter staleyi]|uniref:SusC/RagA family TonB-linked outer membrane protein n=1 Tax=Polaribacter staleyi TaxID=2022337 RepID=UPI0031B9C949
MKTKFNKFLTLLIALIVQITFAQEKTVSGTITDASGPLPGVSVLKKGTNKGVESDFDGKYSIKAKKGDVLVFTYLGYKKTERTVNTSNVINLILTEDESVLEEVIIVGYGTSTKEALTGSVSTISPTQLEEKPVASITQALQGQTAGLQIVSTGGRTGDATQISIRGNGSLSASNSALYIIDGVPQENMNGISSQDVKSISVLKDAASTAIYGSRASNGVILIETKKGSYNQKTSISFNSSYGFQNVTSKPNMLNAAQYKQVSDAARINYENDITKGVLDAPKDPTILTPLPTSSYDTDWLSLVLNKDAVIQNNQFSISGGGENTKSYFSASLFDQEGTIKEDTYKIARLKLNIEQKINDKIKYGINSYFSYSQSNPIVDDNNTYQPYSKALEARPDLSPYDSEGNVAEITSNNPLYAFERKVTDIWQNVGARIYLEAELLEGLTWRPSVSGNIYSNRYNRFDAPDTRRGLNGDGIPTGYGYYSTQNNRDYIIENTLTYNHNFFNDKLKTTLLGGHSFQKWSYEDSYLSGENFPSNDLKWLVSAGEINQGRSYIKEMSLESYFARLDLNWESKYYLMISSRYDGSSKFTEDNRWGNFSAVSTGWVISNEEFFNIPAVDFLKARASFGYTGNQSGIAYTSGQNLISAGENYDNDPGLASTTIFNKNLKWEKGEALNIGLDFGLFNIIDVNLDYYQKETQDLLSRINVPQESGFRTMLANVGNISNKGYEVNLSTQIFDNTDFKWNFSTNFSYNKNEVLKVGSETGQYTTGFVSIVKEGESLGSFYVYEANGVASEDFTYKDQDGNDGQTVAAGDMLYIDQNKDGLINDDDKKAFSGGNAPYYGGFNTKLEYKGLDLNISGQYSIGKRVYAFYKRDLLNGGSIGAPSYSQNMSTEMLNYWTENNKNTSIPRPHLASTISSWNTEHSTRFLENADYLRISDITLGYNFDILEDMNLKFIKSLRIYAQLRNPFTFTKYSGDPETSYVDQTERNSQDQTDGAKIGAGVDLGGIPNTKSFLVGINIKF